MSVKEQDLRAHYQGREIQLYGAQPAFQGNTSYQTDFTAHPIEPRPQVVGRQVAGKSCHLFVTLANAIHPTVCGHVSMVSPWW